MTDQVAGWRTRNLMPPKKKGTDFQFSAQDIIALEDYDW